MKLDVSMNENNILNNVIGSIWHGIKKTFGTTLVDEKETEHREGFTALVREMKQALSVKPNMQLAITVLPNVNASSKLFICTAFSIPFAAMLVDEQVIYRADVYIESIQQQTHSLGLIAYSFKL